jgi:hypothetical protein
MKNDRNKTDLVFEKLNEDLLILDKFIESEKLSKNDKDEIEKLNNLYKVLRQNLINSHLNDVFKKYNTTTDDINRILDLDKVYTTSIISNYIDYVRYPAGAADFFRGKNNLTILDKELYGKKIVFYNQDSFKEFLKDKLYLATNKKLIYININEIHEGIDTTEFDINIETMILEEIRRIEKNNSSLKDRAVKVKQELIEEIINCKDNYLKSSKVLINTKTLKNTYVKEDVCKRNKRKLLYLLEENQENLIPIDRQKSQICDYFNKDNLNIKIYEKQIENYLLMNEHLKFNLILDENKSLPINLYTLDKRLIDLFSKEYPLKADREVEGNLDGEPFYINADAYTKDIGDIIIKNVIDKCNKKFKKLKKEYTKEQSKQQTDIDIKELIENNEVLKNLLIDIKP